MGLRSLMRRDVARILRDDDAFAETITIKPAAAGSYERDIAAIVYRQPLTRQTEDRGRSAFGPIEVEVSKADWPLPAVGDVVKVALTEGGDPVAMKVAEVPPRGEGEDCAMWLLALGR